MFPATGKRKALYLNGFERSLLEASQLFYRLESQRALEANNARHLLELTDRRYREEDARVSAYLHASTRPKLLQIVRAEMLLKNLARIIDHEVGGLNALVDNGDISGLALMYRLLADVTDGHAAMRTVLIANIDAAAHVLADAGARKQ